LFVFAAKLGSVAQNFVKKIYL